MKVKSSKTGEIRDSLKEVRMQFEYQTKLQHTIKDMIVSKGADRNKGRKMAAGVCFYNDKLSLRRCLESLQKDNVDLVFCVDGRFKQFGEKGKYPDLSDDGSRELVLAYDNTVLIDMPDAWEVQKRQAYLKACEDFNIDYLLIIDSDEYILYDQHDPQQGTNWSKFIEKMIQTCESVNYKNYNVFGIDVEIGNKNYVDTVPSLLKMDKNKAFVQHPHPAPNQMPFRRRRFMNLPRLWHNPAQMIYNGKHYAFHPKDPSNELHKIESVPSTWLVPFLFFGHDHVYKQINLTQQRDRLLYQKFLIEFEQHKVNHLFNAGYFHISPDDMDKVEGWYQDVVDKRNFETKAIEDFNELRQRAKEKARLERIQAEQERVAIKT